MINKMQITANSKFEFEKMSIQFLVDMMYLMDATNISVVILLLNHEFPHRSIFLNFQK